VSLHWKKPDKATWMNLINQSQCRLQVWKGKFLFLRVACVVLLNSILSSIPLYYLLIIWCLNKIDSIRRSFLWVGVDSETKKYSLVKWSVVCSPRKFVGFSIYDTWTWHYYLSGGGIILMIQIIFSGNKSYDSNIIHNFREGHHPFGNPFQQ
jgi:hypothetical protein